MKARSRPVLAQPEGKVVVTGHWSVVCGGGQWSVVGGRWWGAVVGGQ